MPESANAPEHRSHSTLAAMQAAGIEDAVFNMLQGGTSLAKVQAFLETKGIEASLPSISKMRAKHMPAWQERQVRDYAEKEFGITEKDLRQVVGRILLCKFAQEVKACSNVDLLMRLWSGFNESERVQTQKNADARAERDSVRKFAMKIEDMLSDEAKLAKMRALREGSIAAGEGVEKRIERITECLWGNWTESEAA